MCTKKVQVNVCKQPAAVGSFCDSLQVNGSQSTIKLYYRGCARCLGPRQKMSYFCFLQSGPNGHPLYCAMGSFATGTEQIHTEVKLAIINSSEDYIFMYTSDAASSDNWGAHIFIYSCSQTVKTIDFKEINNAEHEYGIPRAPPPPPPPQLSSWLRH